MVDIRGRVRQRTLTMKEPLRVIELLRYDFRQSLRFRVLRRTGNPPDVRRAVAQTGPSGRVEGEAVGEKALALAAAAVTWQPK